MARIIVALMFASIVLGCGGSERKQEAPSAKKEVQDTTKTSPPKHMIPSGEFSELDKLAKARIAPYFDKAGTIAEKSVAPGEDFSIYIFGEYNEMYPMAGAEYMLSLPKGIKVLSEMKADSVVMTVGKYSKDFMLAFGCLPGPRCFLMRYNCQATDEFSGGTVETRPGVYHNFMGFSMCDESKTMVRAMPGKAVLKRKGS